MPKPKDELQEHIERMSCIPMRNEIELFNAVEAMIQHLTHKDEFGNDTGKLWIPVWPNGTPKIDPRIGEIAIVGDCKEHGDRIFIMPIDH